jgi:uncharacterized membrane protein YdjX (TVP38/TMEM64 family)
VAEGTDWLALLTAIGVGIVLTVGAKSWVDNSNEVCRRWIQQTGFNCLPLQASEAW